MIHTKIASLTDEVQDETAGDDRVHRNLHLRTNPMIYITYTSILD
jgi:hypothetical protein